ncbi:uncharacterized protein LOC131948929 [Physella acuta]|uniref:uncharacterized protein LOC131948929 n=1 Tax=Physella acuta TaxID=109671 RepID=UPI0027DCDCB7|nr:uncharacterized protein LOC131948929 [Physella acuta]
MGNTISRIEEEKKITDSDKDYFKVNFETKLTNSWGTLTIRDCGNDHGNFIPVKQFKLQDLPEDCRREEIFQCVKTLSSLTCLVDVNGLSTSRPKYEMHKKLLKHRLGTGTVIRVGFDDTSYPQNCKCITCSGLEERVQKVEKTATIEVMTACHVVFDCFEASMTRIKLFYDDESNMKDIVFLQGSHVVSKNVQDDWCVFACRTTDLQLANMLLGMLELYDAQNKKLHEIINEPKDLAVIASHPHGRSKHISIGKWTPIKPITIDSGITAEFLDDRAVYNLHIGCRNTVTEIESSSSSVEKESPSFYNENSSSKTKIKIKTPVNVKEKISHEPVTDDQSIINKSFYSVKGKESADNENSNNSKDESNHEETLKMFTDEISSQTLLNKRIINIFWEQKALDIVKGSKTEFVGIECEVFFPDNTTSLCHLWQIDRKVSDTKHELAMSAGIRNIPEAELYLEIQLPDDQRQEMDDNKELNYYIDDISKAYRIFMNRRII